MRGTETCVLRHGCQMLMHGHCYERWGDGAWCQSGVRVVSDCDSGGSGEAECDNVHLINQSLAAPPTSNHS